MKNSSDIEYNIGSVERTEVGKTISWNLDTDLVAYLADTMHLYGKLSYNL